MPGGKVAAGFGRSLAAEHTTPAVGVPLASQVYFYSCSEDGSWELSETLIRPHDQFGASIALKGDRLLIGKVGGTDSEGGVYLYSRDEHGFWQMMRKLSRASASSADQFGHTVAIHEEDLVVGVPRWNHGRVRVFVYSLDGTSDLPVQEIQSSAGKGGDQFGESIEFIEGFLAIGASGHHGAASYSFLGMTGMNGGRSIPLHRRIRRRISDLENNWQSTIPNYGFRLPAITNVAEVCIIWGFLRWNYRMCSIQMLCSFAVNSE